MAFEAPPKRSPRAESAMSLGSDAIEADDSSLMEEALAMAAEPGLRLTRPAIMRQCLEDSFHRRAMQVARDLLEKGADVSVIWPSMLRNSTGPEQISWPTIEVLDLLVAYGWDLNPRPQPRNPRFPREYGLIHQVLDREDQVRWCLNHGADVTQEDHRTLPPWMPKNLLQSAIYRGNITIFELLRSRGAPMGNFVLQLAVQMAAEAARGLEIPVTTPMPIDPQPSLHGQHIAMMRHLVDVCQLDIQ